ncbi:carbohydrate porin [Candidatus Dependentiae bacterium]
MKKKNFLLNLLLCLVICTANTHTKQLTSEKSCEVSHKKKFKSISPGYIMSLRHYPKYYGDPNTIHGTFLDRSYILDDPKKFRTKLSNRGIYLDATLFSFLGANASGGTKTGFARYNGNAEYWLVIDTGKTGLWPRGALMMHAESSWTVEDSINDDVGSLLAVNSRSRVPVPDKEKTTLSEVVLAQFFTDNIGLRVGKLDATGPIDGTTFANNARFQFLYAGLVNNPIIFNFTSYTSLALMPFFNHKKHQLLFFVADAEGQADKSGLDSVFNGNTSYCTQYTFSPKARKRLPGNYRIIYAHAKKPITSYELDGRHLTIKNTDQITIPKKCQNSAWLLNFDQYIWVNKDNEHIEHRHYRPPVGVLLFGRAGWAPQDRNVIDQFYSIGIGSYGLLKKRYYDQWGIGYAATHISISLREDLKNLDDVCLDKFEHGFEAFYNAQLTPALHLSVHMQVVKSPLKSRSPSLVFNSRLQTDF